MDEILKIYNELEPNDKVVVPFDSPLWNSLYKILLNNWETLEISDFNLEVAMFLYSSDLEPVIIRTTEMDLSVLTTRFLFLENPDYNLKVLKKKVLLSVDKFSIINKSFFDNDTFWELLRLFWQYCQFTQNWFGTMVLGNFDQWDRVNEIFIMYPDYGRLDDTVNTELWNSFRTGPSRCSIS